MKARTYGLLMPVSLFLTTCPNYRYGSGNSPGDESNYSITAPDHEDICNYAYDDLLLYDSRRHWEFGVPAPCVSTLENSSCPYPLNFDDGITILLLIFSSCTAGGNGQDFFYGAATSIIPNEFYYNEYPDDPTDF